MEHQIEATRHLGNFSSAVSFSIAISSLVRSHQGKRALVRASSTDCCEVVGTRNVTSLACSSGGSSLTRHLSTGTEQLARRRRVLNKREHGRSLGVASLADLHVKANHQGTPRRGYRNGSFWRGRYGTSCLCAPSCGIAIKPQCQPEPSSSGVWPCRAVWSRGRHLRQSSRLHCIHTGR